MTRPVPLRHAGAGALLVALAGCVSIGGPPGPPTGTYAERLDGFARLLAMEDRRAYDPQLAGRTAISPDAWLRAKTALAAGRLRDPDASVIIPPLLGDPEASVRRAAALGAGISLDVRLVPLLAKALADADEATAANAAEALGKIGGAEATNSLLAVLARSDAPASTRAAAALAMFRKPEPGTVGALVRTFGEESLAPELRRAVVYSLARKPQPEAAPALRAVLRMKGEGRRASSDEVAWAARGLGILGDESAANSSPRIGLNVSIAVQALTALSSLSEECLLGSPDLARAHGGECRRGDDPARRGDRRAPPPRCAARRPESRAVLEESLRPGVEGDRLRSRRPHAPRRAAEGEKAVARIDAAIVSDTSRDATRRGRGAGVSRKRDRGQEKISSNDPLATAVFADRRLGCARPPFLPFQRNPRRRHSMVLRGLVDRPAVRDVVASRRRRAAPRRRSADLSARGEAFRRAFESGEPDFTVGALDAPRRAARRVTRWSPRTRTDRTP